MLRFNLRELTTKQERKITLLHRFFNSSSSDDEKPTKNKEKSKPKIQDKPELKRLNDLLKKMIEEDVAIKSTKPLPLARPKGKKSKDQLIKEKALEDEPVAKKLEVAAKEVAKTIGGNVKQTESELLQKLLGTVSETTPNLSDIIKDMKIDRETKASEVSRAHQVRELLGRVQTRQAKELKMPLRKRTPKFVEPTVHERVNLFGSEPLGIFTSEELSEGAENKTWNKLYNRELRLTTIQPPSNYFQEMILWTDQGKIWQFPINNEQGLEEEQKVPFMEHVFLEKHLEPWCPTKGPLRHFMELVCVGLSKNPYLTVEKKREHIEWFKNYFSEKQKLLKEVGAVPAQFDINVKETKKIEA